MTALGAKMAKTNGTGAALAKGHAAIVSGRPHGKERRVKDTGFRVADFLAEAGLGKVVVHVPKDTTVFSQGDAADTIFYIQKGKIKIAVVSARGKEATVAVFGAGQFVGEDCIAISHPIRLVTATALTDCVLLKIGKKEMVRVLAHDQTFT